MDNNTTIGLDTSPAVRAMAQLEAASKTLASALNALNAASPQRMTAEMAAVGVAMADMTATLKKGVDIIKAELGAGAKAAGAAVGKGMADGIKDAGEGAVRTAKELRQLLQAEYEALAATTKISPLELQGFRARGVDLIPDDKIRLEAMQSAVKSSANVLQVGRQIDKAAEDEYLSRMGWVAKLQTGSLKVAEAQAEAAQREANAKLAWQAKMQVGSAKISEQVEAQANAEYLARMAWVGKLQTGSLKVAEAQAEAAQREANAKLAWQAKMQVGSAKIAEQIEAQANAEYLARMAWVAKLQTGSLKVAEAQAEAERRERLTILGRAAQVQFNAAALDPVGPYSISSGARIGRLVGVAPEVEEAKATVAAADAAKAALKSLSEEKAAAKAKAREAAEASRELSRELNSVHSAARGVASGFNAMWLTWGQLAPLLAGAALSHSFVQAVKDGSEFENTLVSIRELSGSTAAEMKLLADEALRLGSTSKYGPIEVAAGLKSLALAGLDAQQQLQALKPTLNFATAGEMPVDKAAESLIAISTAFGYTADGMGAVGDVIAKAAAVSMSSITDMTEAFRQASTVAQQFGVTITDASSVLALLSQLGIRGSAAGTAMRNMYNELIGGSKQARAVLKETLNVDIIDNQTKSVKGLDQVFRELGAALKQYNFKDQLVILQTLGNERGSKAISAVLTAAVTDVKNAGKDVSTILDDMAQKLADAPGFVAIAAAGMALSSQNQLKAVANAMESTLIKAFDQAKPAVQEFSVLMREVFNSPEFVDGVTRMVSAVASLGSLIADNMGVVGSVAVLMGGWVAALTASAVATKVATVTLGGLNATLSLVGVGAVGASVGVQRFMAALGPITAALTLAAAAWYMLRDASESSSEKAARADATRVKATMAALAAEEERLKEQIKLRREGTSQAQLSASVEANLMVQSIAMSHDRTIAANQEAHAKLLANRATLAGTEYANTGQGANALRQMDLEIANSRGRIADAVLKKYAEVEKAEDQIRRVKTLAAIDAKEATAKIEVDRLKRPTGPKTFDPDARNPTRSEVLDPVRELERSTRGIFDAFGRQTDELDREAKDRVAKLNFTYAMGLASYEETEKAKDVVQAKHVKDRQELLDLEIAMVNAAMQDLEDRAKRANAIRPGTVTDEALQNSREGFQTRLNGLLTKQRQLVDEISRADEASALRRAKPLLDATKAAADKSDNVQIELAALAEEEAFRRELLKMRRVEAEVATAERKASASFRQTELNLLKQIREYEEGGGDPAALARARSELDRLRVQRTAAVKAAGDSARTTIDEALRAKADPLKGMKDGLDDYLDKVNDVAGAMKGTMTRAFQGMEDALVEFATTGKLNFKSLAQSIISDLIRIQIQQSITKPLAQAMGKGNILSTIAGFFGFENGGVMSAQGSMPLRAYSSGGVANSPQLALYGEGRMPEAYVPLPDGRSIPVTMKGGAQPAGANVTVNVIESPREAGTQKRRTDSNGNEVIDVFVARIKAEVAGDIARGSGPVSAALQGTYGLNRVAGAY